MGAPAVQAALVERARAALGDLSPTAVFRLAACGWPSDFLAPGQTVEDARRKAARLARDLRAEGERTRRSADALDKAAAECERLAETFGEEG
jgi:hypothetical protein